MASVAGLLAFMLEFSQLEADAILVAGAETGLVLLAKLLRVGDWSCTAQERGDDSDI